MVTLEQKRTRVIEIVPKLSASLREQIYNKLEGYPRTYNANCYHFNMDVFPDDLLDEIYEITTFQDALQSTETNVMINENDDQNEDETAALDEDNQQPKQTPPKKIVESDDEYSELCGTNRKRKGKFEHWLEKSRSKAKVKKRAP